MKRTDWWLPKVGGWEKWVEAEIQKFDIFT